MPDRSQLDPDALWRVADRLADAARIETLNFFRRADLLTESKRTDFDPVTEADRASERAMRAILAEARPHDGILGEEEADTEGSSGLTWVIDPIDGTRSFISGTPTWGVLVALSDTDGPILGLIDQPYIRERFSGGLGRAEIDSPTAKTRLKVRNTRTLSEATLFTTFPEIGTEAERTAFFRVEKEVRLTRYGCDCYAYALLAAGHIDLVIEAGLQPFDIHAPIAVIEAAGGIVTDWEGGPAYGGGRVLAAATRDLHEAAMERLRG